MIRIFYRIEDKTYFDKKAFAAMARENYAGADEINEIIGMGLPTTDSRLVEV